MDNNPYQSRPGRNPSIIFGWIFVLGGLLSVYLAEAWASAGGRQEEEPSLVSEAWMVHHGIETSQWKDPRCKARALELVDETKLTRARLDQALQLALNAATADCRRARDGDSPGAPRVVRRQ